jgi:hypothetical protein
LDYSYHNVIVDDGTIYNFKTKKRIHFLKIKNLINRFVDHESVVCSSTLVDRPT